MNINNVWRERLKFFILGALTIIGILFITGAKDYPLPSGRYQISSWGTQFGTNSGGCGAFVIDTNTGETKTAYTVIYGTPEGQTTLKNNLKKHFSSMD